MEASAPWGSPTPALSRNAAWALASVAALPGLALLTYGWGVLFGAAWAVTLAATARTALRMDDPRHAWLFVARRIWLAAMVLGPLVTVLSDPFHEVSPLLVVSCVGSVVGGLLAVAWFFPAWRCVERSREPTGPGSPLEESDAVLRCALGVSWVGAASFVCADEPLWPLMALVVGAGVALAVRTLRRESRATAWLREVAAGRVDGWALHDVTGGAPGRAWLVALRGTAYRGTVVDGAVAQVKARRSEGAWQVATRRRGGTLAAHGAGMLLCLAGAALSHGYELGLDLDGLLTGRPTSEPVGLAALVNLWKADARVLVVDRAPPEAVWTRVTRHKTLRRMGQYRIPGVDLWRDCKSGSCRGVTIVVDEHGRVLDVPAVMARLRDRPLREQVQWRYTLMAGRGRPERLLEVRRCGRRVIVRVEGWGVNDRQLMDFDTGEVTRIEGEQVPDCR